MDERIEMTKAFTRLTEDEIAKFLTKTERKNCKNAQNKSLDGEHCKEKLCQEIGERFE